jgi:hypothetical protein
MPGSRANERDRLMAGSCALCAFALPLLGLGTLALPAELQLPVAAQLSLAGGG